ncbi:type VII secretion-associated serine protease mycosin [Actinacidiphila acididurans]|uniref:Type VII secretion-associated serine protease mycosin n=1 Tax=Actinacidiphila acididurans TaxID=2784346 RepID=A0ABS2U8Q5_9ACTN|nr:type VII secretion-associated serine protease mycosin [Actinacidiphila acididurans]MBM9510548.1 type VII secretion-associated serine protease mycosin [Actinacidiphila acididurans]
MPRPALLRAPAPAFVAARLRPGAGAARLLTGLVAAGLSLALATPPASADAARQADWALAALHAQTAWQTTQGKGVTVAVLDTGVDAIHPDLTGQVLPGKDEVGFGAERGDSYWAKHGTGMAAIIAGHGHGPGDSSGVLGIAPQARILPVRVILEDKDPQRPKARTSRGSALPDGIRWAADHGADVINLSLGDDSATAAPVAAEDNAIQYALSKGVVVVASAGNGGDGADRSSYPAAYPGVIAVAAVDRYGAYAPFSTRRWYASVAAPGVDVVIADPDRTYYQGWGTSAASAYASGAVALIRSAYPKLSPAQIKQLLESTTRHRPKGGRDDEVGTGEIDPAAALAAARKLTPGPAVPAAVTYPHRYFGPGPALVPRPADPDQVLGDGVATVFALAGAGLVAVAALLWLRPRRRAPIR